MKSKILGLLAAGLLAGPMAANAVPFVSYGVSGSENNWVLDFSVTNNIQSAASDMVIYFFGVRLPERNILGSPLSWNPDVHLSWNAASSVSPGLFNNNWIDSQFSAATGSITFGSTLSGFRVIVTSVEAPATVDWFAYGFQGTYSGDEGTFEFSRVNPLFVGTALARADSVSEPGTLALLGLGLAGLGVSRRRRVA